VERTRLKALKMAANAPVEESEVMSAVNTKGTFFGPSFFYFVSFKLYLYIITIHSRHSTVTTWKHRHSIA